jgi:hypothetical protein
VLPSLIFLGFFRLRTIAIPTSYWPVMERLVPNWCQQQAQPRPLSRFEKRLRAARSRYGHRVETA